MVEKQTQYITLALVALIVIATGVVLYTSLPTDSNESTSLPNETDEIPSKPPKTNKTDITEEEKQKYNQTNNNQSIDFSNISFSVFYNATETVYNLTTLESMTTYTGKGQYIKTKLLPDAIVISDMQNYTGVPIKSFLNPYDTELPDNFNVTITSSDGWVIEYTKDQVLGNITYYAENGSILSYQLSVMILAYKEEGFYYDEIDPEREIGPLRIAFIGSKESTITSSNLWSKMVTSMQIIPLP